MSVIDKIKSRFVWGLGIITILIVASIILYSYCTGWLPSSSNSDWGDFGSFIGGFWGPFIALANVLALFFLQKAISEHEEEKLKRQKIYEQKMSHVERIEKVTELIFDTFLTADTQTKNEKLKNYGGRLLLLIENLKTTSFIEAQKDSNLLCDELLKKTRSFIITPEIKGFIDINSSKEKLLNKLFE